MCTSAKFHKCIYYRCVKQKYIYLKRRYFDPNRILHKNKSSMLLRLSNRLKPLFQIIDASFMGASISEFNLEGFQVVEFKIFAFPSEKNVRISFIGDGFQLINLSGSQYSPTG